MNIYKKPNGKWQVRWREDARRCGRTFDRKGDALDYMGWLRRRQQLGLAAVPDDVPLAQLIESYWRLHAVPNLSPATRDLYNRVWSLHIAPRLGDYGVRELTPKRLIRFRAELLRAGVGTATVVKAMTIVQSILAFAVSEELVEYNAAAGMTSPATSAPASHTSSCPSRSRRSDAKLDLRDRTLVSVLAYSGPRPEEVVCRLAWGDMGEHTTRYVDTKRHHIRHTPLLKPLAEDLTEWFLASGRPSGTCPVFPAHDGGFWQQDDWRNWRKRIWQASPSGPAGIARTRPPHAPDAPPRTPGHETCDRAT